MFAELLARSCYSFLRGASHPEELVAQAHECGVGAIAICDRDGLYGAVRAHGCAQELGQRFVVGAELALASDPNAPVVALLVESREGYANLCRLITLAHAGRPKGESALDVAWLAEHCAGLTAIVPAPQQPGGSDTPPLELLAAIREIFADRAALGTHRHLDGFDGLRETLIVGYSERFDLPIVASARPLYHVRDRKGLCDVLCCIRNGTTLDDAGSRLQANSEAFLRSPAVMRRLFRDRLDWVERSGEIAARLEFSLSELRYEFPCSLEPGETADAKLRRLTWAGARRRYPSGVPGEVSEQLERELRLIAQLRKAPYFLSTWEVVEMARRRRILCQGRGSAANSAVCYALGITAVDPARSRLLFERFMSPERDEPPDIDIDFEHERREEVIQEIYDRYGRDRAAMVSEIISYRGKSALRDVGKAFGLSLEQVDSLAQTIGHWDGVTASRQHVAESGLDASDGRVKQVLDLAQELQGFPRHLSVHVGGFVLSSEPLCHVAPIEPARMPGRTVIPWDKDDIEALGFFKVDVLGLGMLTAVRKCLELIHADGGLRGPDGASESFDPLEVMARVPPEDPAVYQMISRADTIGVFQIESRAQMAMLPRLRPARFYDLVIEVAIVRPGPIQGGMVHPYLRRRNGEEHVAAPHPELWPILERTLGVPLFQEQVMQIAIVGAGYTGGEADQLRRDMAAWKRSGRLFRHRQRLLDGFAEKGIGCEFGEALFEQIKGFGEYGFPESHAASFALIVYASAWQKTHYPAHFACALINSQPMGFYSPSAIIQDAQRHGVQVRDVCVSHSFWNCSLEGNALRLGLRLVKGLGEAAGRRLEKARGDQAWGGIDDLIRRAALRKDEVEALAEAGALESVIQGRRQALWMGRAPRVGGLFRGLETREPEVHLPELSKAAQLMLDYGRKGLSVNDHPMRHLRELLRRRGVITTDQVSNARRGQMVSVAGLVTCRQRPATASGVVFITVEDETGHANLIVYHRVFEQFRQVARNSSLLLAYGRVEREQKTRPKQEGTIVHVIVRELERLDRPGGGLRRMSRDFH